MVAVTSFTDYDDAIIASDTSTAGAGVWERDGSTAYRWGGDIQAGRVCCYHLYPAHAAFRRHKQSEHRPGGPE